MPTVKRLVPCCDCGKLTTGLRCRSCAKIRTDDLKEPTDAELDALIAKWKDTMPPDDETTQAGNGKTLGAGRMAKLYEGYTLPAKRFCRIDRRLNRYPIPGA